MARPQGMAKTGGRVAGTPNKSTQALMERLESLDCDPIKGIAEIARDPATDPQLKVRCYAELAQYIHPKRKAVDISAAEDSQLKIVIEYL